MIVNDLMPASPLMPSSSANPPLPPASVEARTKLMDRRAQLEKQVCLLWCVCMCVCQSVCSLVPEWMCVCV